MNFKQKVAQNPTISKAVTKTWKAGPTIAFVVGAAGSAASLYLMWRAARKHDEVMTEAMDILDEVHAKRPEETVDENGKKTFQETEESYAINQYRTELIKAYVKAGFKIGKLYAPVAITEIASISLMSIGYGKLNNRYLGSVAAYSLLDRQFLKYRDRVIGKYGEEADQYFKYGLKETEYEVPELDKSGNPKVDKNGVIKVRKEIEKTLEDEDLDLYSSYARIFDKDHCKNFDTDEDDMATSYYNRTFLMRQQDYFNMLLKYRPSHTVFLNEVYDGLGYERTKEGQVVGWHYDPDYPTGDNKIEFVPVEFFNEKFQAKSVIIDFNVDGNVWDLL